MLYSRVELATPPGTYVITGMFCERVEVWTFKCLINVAALCREKYQVMQIICKANISEIISAVYFSYAYTHLQPLCQSPYQLGFG